MEDLRKAPLVGGVGVTDKKRKDFENLLEYCTSSGQDIGKIFLSTTSVKNKVCKEEKISKRVWKREDGKKENKKKL